MDIKDEIDRAQHSKTTIWLIVAGMAVFVLWVGNWFLAVKYLGRPNGPGPFGDLFGAVNALFSGLAFLGVIWAIVLQSRQVRMQGRELSLQRKELKLQRQELVLTRGVLKAQGQTLDLQRFENTFFQLLELKKEFVEDLQGPEQQYSINNDRRVRGTPLFAAEYLLRSWTILAELKVTPTLRRELAEQFDELRDKWKIDVGPYFRCVYQIVKFVDRSGIDPEPANDTTRSIEERQRYMNILRATMTHDEQGLLFYNCLSSYGDEKFKPLVLKYALLEGLRWNEAYSMLRAGYDAGAFEERKVMV